MNYETILQFIGQYPVCTLSTCVDGEPHVRAFLSNIVDGKVYFTTSANKNVGKQILQNPKSELCYLSGDFSKMLRISTTIEVLDDKQIKQHLIDTRDYLKGFSVDSDELLLLGLSGSSATIWTMANNLQENLLEVVRF